jgi:ubiquinone/menaquinone biosynthesis C-methylase UbiE
MLDETVIDKKKKGAEFWDGNPCGGQWNSQRQLLDWSRSISPFMYEIYQVYDWDDKLVVDVGCGQGRTPLYLSTMGAKVVGLDMSRSSLKRAVMGAEEFGFSKTILINQADAENLPLPGNYFDRGVSIGVLHHTPDTQAGINEIYRVLKPGGFYQVIEAYK